jgi:hypothetical protein
MPAAAAAAGPGLTPALCTWRGSPTAAAARRRRLLIGAPATATAAAAAAAAQPRLQRRRGRRAHPAACGRSLAGRAPLRRRRPSQAHPPRERRPASGFESICRTQRLGAGRRARRRRAPRTETGAAAARRRRRGGRKCTLGGEQEREGAVRTTQEVAGLNPRLTAPSVHSSCCRLAPLRSPQPVSSSCVPTRRALNLRRRRRRAAAAVPCGAHGQRRGGHGAGGVLQHCAVKERELRQVRRRSDGVRRQAPGEGLRRASACVGREGARSRGLGVGVRGRNVAGQGWQLPRPSTGPTRHQCASRMRALLMPSRSRSYVARSRCRGAGPEARTQTPNPTWVSRCRKV